MYACSGVHSDLDVGFDMGITMGRAHASAAARTTSSEKTPGTVESPSRHVGANCRTASAIGVPSLTAAHTHGARSAERPRAWFGSPRAPSGAPSAPCDVTTQKRAIAASRLRPASTMPSTIAAHTPRPAEPAPAHTKRCSVSGTPACALAASRPASVTQPVPWMSSLKQRCVSRYLASSGTALGVSKSSNCTTTSGQRR